ncbi:hypothetical protein PUN28_004073 [Cardiocondyla obscurior]|uniref:Uncharacterized protein n=1 Tax=Cardiocondyla obscurior TaxID=286306 RepID=A0AAW2GLM8_9HYME
MKTNLFSVIYSIRTDKSAGTVFLRYRIVTYTLPAIRAIVNGICLSFISLQSNVIILYWVGCDLTRIYKEQPGIARERQKKIKLKRKKNNFFFILYLNIKKCEIFITIKYKCCIE